MTQNGGIKKTAHQGLLRGREACFAADYVPQRVIGDHLLSFLSINVTLSLLIFNTNIPLKKLI